MTTHSTLLSVLLLLATPISSIVIHKGTSDNTRHAHKQKANTRPQETPYQVPCPDSQRSCSCPEHVTACTFTLTIKELQTFTSYKLLHNKDDNFSDGSKRAQTKGSERRLEGDAYYLDRNGFTPTLPPYVGLNKPPEYGECYFQNVTLNEETFDKNNCSVPITTDGATFRMFIAVNGQTPGPTLIVHEDQVVHVRVVNKLTSDCTSVHWHGVRQYQTPWMDGVGLVSQPPIVPGAHFDYVFRATPPGTHWYHSHVGAQRSDGLYGGLVIQERENTLQEMEYVDENRELVDRPEEHTILLIDWQREGSLNLYMQVHYTIGYFPDSEIGKVPTQLNSLYRRTYSADGIEVGPSPFWSGLMNGRGRHSTDTFGLLSTLEVERGASYRFRLVGAQALFAFKFSIDNHKLQLIATDGNFIEQVTVDFIIIHSGERYDFILHADQEIDNYWMRAETLEADTSESHTAEGILHYVGAHPVDPRNKYTDIAERRRECRWYDMCVAVNCPFEAYPKEINTKCLHLDQLDSKITPTRPTPRILQPTDEENLKFFNFGFEGTSTTSAINSRNFVLPTTPYQTYCEQYELDNESETVLCQKKHVSNKECVHMTQIAKSETYTEHREEFPSVNFVLSTVGTRGNNFSHPIHLHGHSFYVVAIRHGTYDASGKMIRNNDDIQCRDENGNLDELCVSPRWKDNTLPPGLGFKGRIRERAILKDTVIVPAGGYVVIAFEADNPGYWFMHCHIESHQLEGMAVIIQEYPPTQQWAPPPGINKVGSFTWSMDDYRDVVESAEKCPEQ